MNHVVAVQFTKPCLENSISPCNCNFIKYMLIIEKKVIYFIRT